MMCVMNSSGMKQEREREEEKKEFFLLQKGIEE